LLPLVAKTVATRGNGTVARTAWELASPDELAVKVVVPTFDAVTKVETKSSPFDMLRDRAASTTLEFEDVTSIVVSAFALAGFPEASWSWTTNKFWSRLVRTFGEGATYTVNLDGAGMTV
jgi:hypothetical protein